LNLLSNFQFNSIWHTRSMAALVLCWRLAESDITPCHQSHVWIDYVGDTITWLI